ncbi:MAG: OsmC family protein [Candidatus Aminicenantes bacterium]|nr:OsmC family protein [Candidatus Aminicenantes bacterium]
MEAKVIWNDGMSFTAKLDGFDIIIDADENVGGENLGPRPKGLTLISLAGCTGMDVISILKKMRINVDSFEVSTEASLTEEHPKRFKSIKLIYEFKGTDIPLDKVKKAVSLSEERYCGVSETLKPKVEITNEIRINGKTTD